MKPNFLGIGSVRGGSTWLHYVLDSHPSFVLPKKRKEVQFFTKYYERGDEWYFDFFDGEGEVSKSKMHIGEITPGYLIAPYGPERIAQLECIEKFVLILRNPIDRTFSHYKWHLRVTGEDINFKQFYEGISRIAIENSLYFKHIERYLEYFEKEQFLILIFEEVIRTPQTCFNQLSAFFDVDPSHFSIPPQVNQSTIPKFRRLFNKAHKVTGFLRKKDLDWIPNLIIGLGGKNWFGKSKTKNKKTLSKIDKDHLFDLFQEDVHQLENLLGRPLDSWGFND